MRIAHQPVRSSLAKYQPRQTQDEASLKQLRTRAWREQGVLVIRPEDLADGWERITLQSIGSRIYGRQGK
ncbi:hypothetical protein ACUHMQ_16750 [Chitinimonas sp. PSY-7]|uniref:hypothetical protein n=1 Tax=Chitinimonas sp. PSY-7 TaxID=3459088 RepID=UPI00403FE961